MNEITLTRITLTYLSEIQIFDTTGQFMPFLTQAKYFEKLCIITFIAIWKNLKYLFHLSLVLGNDD